MSRKQTPLRPYFEKMADIGKALSEAEVRRSQENIELVQEQEQILALEEETGQKRGYPRQENPRAGRNDHL